MKKVLKALGGFLERLFAGARHLMKRYAEPAIQVLQLVKPLLDSQLPARLADLTPTKVDDILVGKIHAAIPKAMIALELVKCVDASADPNEIVSCGVDRLKEMGVDLRRNMIGDLAVQIAFYMADGKLTYAECRLAVEYWYQKYYAADRIAA